ncbi:hypothetical protein BCR37DRAFT_390737 [Protomyces lactucae-debilis]|uniref:Cell wall mannoprotein PIR1-like C-terminal domain-containing protein n=1 Tax=Protomyces lactucae-debilis TaxID=2754530 RepID=A0A1Y2FSV6_PROLT|nr:uncharacterized protein BCR37DRAFT_390737 [Protomyces lactucae-debilis]ORY87019.1 hypothetical protein BCR37DRAFT_390737 [Protomyces lactucae-debilis]
MKTFTVASIAASLAAVSAQGVTAIISAPGSAPSACTVSKAGVFGIQVIAPSGTTMAKRQVTQIADGQVQAGRGPAIARPVTQIGDGQIQAPQGAASAPAARPVTQIGDGQIQAPKGAAPAPAAQPVTQIGDGQIQAPTGNAPRVVTVTVTRDNCVASPITQIADGQIQAPMARPITQIGDGQIQAPTGRAPAGNPVTQIGDGQIQAPTGRPVTQIGDGQIQAPTGRPVTQIGDGQIQAPKSGMVTAVRPPAAAATNGKYAVLSGAAQACGSSDPLQITLVNGVLRDNQNRIGYIAANSQFQFDGPPQTGAIYTAGWSVCANNTLALGGSTEFYRCLSGSFYNLYYRNVLNAAQCERIAIEAVQLNNC